MKDRLEFSIASLKMVNLTTMLRLDSDYYLKKYVSNEEITKKKSMKNLSSLGLKVDASAFYPSLEPYYNQGEIPFIRVADVNFFIDYDNCVNIPQLSSEFNTLKMAHKGDIVLTKGGTIGRVGRIEKDSFVTRDLIFLNSSSLDKIDSITLLFYLNSKFSYENMVRTSSLSVQPHLTISMIRELPILSFSDDLKEALLNLYNNITERKSKSKELYAEAEKILLKELGLNNYELSKEKNSIKNLSSSFLESGRLDAEYYQLKYDEIIKKIESYKFGSAKISEKFKRNETSYNLKREEHKYVEIGDVNISNNTFKYNMISNDKLPTNAKYLIKKGDLLYSTVRPYRGAVTISKYDDKDIAASGAFIILQENSEYLKEILILLLKLNIYKEYIMKYNVGSSYPVVRDVDVLNLKIPLIPHKIQQEVANKMKKLFLLNEESEKLLNSAVESVEIAIEKTEEEAIKYLKEEIKKLNIEI